jgi:hypothetical protein
MTAQAHYNKTADLMTMHQATFIDLPIAGMKWGWGVGKEQDVVQEAWKGYDAWVRLTSASIDGLYKNSLFVEMTAQAIERSLRWRLLSQALTGAFFAGLWSAVGLPTTVTIQALTEEIQSLTEEIQSLTDRLTAQDLQIQALCEEVRSLNVNPPNQRTKRAPTAKLDTSLNTAPLKINGRRLIHFPLAAF